MRVDRRKKKLFCSPQSYILMLILPPIHTITEKKQNGVDRGAGGKGRKKEEEEKVTCAFLFLHNSLVFPTLKQKGKRMKVSCLNSEAFQTFITLLKTLIHSHPTIMQL